MSSQLIAAALTDLLGISVGTRGTKTMPVWPTLYANESRPHTHTHAHTYKSETPRSTKI